MPITATTPGCFGVCCSKHARCERYASVEFATADNTIATCDDGKGGRPLFVDLATLDLHEAATPD